MIDPSANFSGFPAGYSPFAAMAQAFQAPQTAAPVQFPQMTPQSMGYGPMHSALAQSLAQALQAQMSGGLLGSATPQSMGLLSTAMIPSQAVGLPTNGAAPALGPNQYYRMDNPFWGAMPTKLGGDNNDKSGKNRFGGDGGPRGRNDFYADRGGNGGFTPNPGRGNWDTGERGVYGGGSDTYGIF